MKRTLLSLLISLALVLASPFARGVEGDLLPAPFPYPGYADVREDDWFYDNAVLCYETGLITGSDKGFEPYREMTVAEAAAVAARLCEAATGEAIVFGTPLPGQDIPWYQWYFDYLEQRGVAGLSQPGAKATRSGFLSILSAVLPNELLEPVNQISALPDTADADVLRFYHAGILTGTDKYGTFAPDKSLTRAEGAAMAARIVRPSLRLTFTPADYAPFAAAGLAPSDVLFTNGAAAEQYLDAALSRILALEAACAEEGIEFNWFHTVDGKTFLDDVKNGALDALGVTEDQGTPAFEAFDVQVFYSRYLDLTQ